MSIEFRVPIMFSFTTLLICLLLDSAVFQLLPRYYEKVRLLKFLQNRLVLFGLVGPYHYWRTPDLPGTLHLPYARSPCPTPPADPALSRFTTTHCCLRWRHATSTSACLFLRGSIASRFRITALKLLCLRLSLASQLRLQD
jgi:hypothetical protein